MICKYSDFDGKCQLWEFGEMFEHIAKSCDDTGVCLVEDDSDPSMSCEDYKED